MKNLRIAILGLFVFAGYACTEVVEPAQAPGVDPVATVVTATTDVDTKVNFTDSDNTVTVKWNASGEAFSAFVGNTEAAPVVKFDQIANTLSADGKATDFSAVLPEETTEFYAFYPAQEITAGNPKAVTLDFTNQTGKAMDAAYTYMYAKGSVADGKVAKLNFKQLTSVLALTLDFGTEVTGTLNTVALSQWEVTRTATVDITGETPVYTRVDPGEGVMGSLTVSCDVPITDGKATVYVHLRPCTYGDITVEARVGRDLYSFTLPGRRTEAGKYYSKTLDNPTHKGTTLLKGGDYEFLKAIFEEGCYNTPYGQPNWFTQFPDGTLPGMQASPNADGSYSLKEINISIYANNHLQKWPKKMHLEDLERINLGRYAIDGVCPIAGTELPSDWNTPKLKKITLSNCAMTGTIPEGLASSTPELAEIYVDGNDFYGALPHNWVSKKLEVLMFTGNTGIGYMVPATFDVILNSERKAQGDKTQIKIGGNASNFVGYEQGWGQVRYEKFDEAAVPGDKTTWSDWRGLCETSDEVDTWAYYYNDLGGIPKEMKVWNQADADAYTEKCRAERTE